MLNAYNLTGRELTLELDGLFARAVQHEVDHLDGVLFTDRLSPTSLADARGELERFEEQFITECERGEIPDERTIAARAGRTRKVAHVTWMDEGRMESIPP